MPKKWPFLRPKTQRPIWKNFGSIFGHFLGKKRRGQFGNTLGQFLANLCKKNGHFSRQKRGQFMPLFKCLCSNAFVWMPSFECLRSNAFVQMPSFKCLCLNAFLWMPSFKCLSSNAFVWMPLFECLRLNVFVWRPSFQCFSSYFECFSASSNAFVLSSIAFVRIGSNAYFFQTDTWTQFNQPSYYFFLSQTANKIWVKRMASQVLVLPVSSRQHRLPTSQLALVPCESLHQPLWHQPVLPKPEGPLLVPIWVSWSPQQPVPRNCPPMSSWPPMQVMEVWSRSELQAPLPLD